MFSDHIELNGFLHMSSMKKAESWGCSAPPGEDSGETLLWCFPYMRDPIRNTKSDVLPKIFVTGQGMMA